MKYSKIALLTSALLGMIIVVSAQTVDLSSFWSTTTEAPRPEFSAILLEGESLYKPGVADGPLTVEAGTKGTLSVSTVDRTDGAYKPMKPIGFKIAIRVYETNSMWMYSEETFYEVDLEEVARECKMGDTIIFMTVDKKYQLSRHELIVIDDC